HRTVLPRRVLPPSRPGPDAPRACRVGQGVPRAGGPADRGARRDEPGTSGGGCGVVPRGLLARPAERRRGRCPGAGAGGSPAGEADMRSGRKQGSEAGRGWVRGTLLGLALAEVALSIFQWAELRTVQAGGTAICSINTTVNCETVWTSPFAQRLGAFTGLPVA